jgi:hypothetical protein
MTDFDHNEDHHRNTSPSRRLRTDRRAGRKSRRRRRVPLDRRDVIGHDRRDNAAGD